MSPSEAESGWTRLLSSAAVTQAGGVAERVAAVLLQAEAVIREAASFVDSCLVKDADDDDGMDEPTVVLSPALAYALQRQKGRFVVKMPNDVPDNYKGLLSQSLDGTEVDRACKLETSDESRSSFSSDLRCRTCNSAFASRSELRAHALEHVSRFEGVTVTPTDKQIADPDTFDLDHLVGDEEEDDDEESESDGEQMVVEPHFMTKTASEEDDDDSDSDDKPLATRSSSQGHRGATRGRGGRGSRGGRTGRGGIRVEKIVNVVRFEVRCGVCGFASDDRDVMAEHRDSHVGEKPFKCDLCEYASAFRQCLTIHRLRRHGGADAARFCCEMCGRAFVRKCFLDAHMEVHREQPTNMCHVCGKGFKGKNSLRRHVQGSHKAKPSVCPHCGDVMKNSTNLKFHILRKHSDAPYRQSFECKLCGESVQGYVAFKDHCAFVHRGAAPVYACSTDGCARQFSLKSKLNRHIKEAHRKAD